MYTLQRYTRVPQVTNLMKVVSSQIRRNCDHATPLSLLSEEDQMMREMTRKFAQERIGPLVRPMEKAGSFDKDLVKELFDQGLMGMEVPEKYGGSGVNLFTSCLAIEEIARVDPSIALMVDIQNTLINRSIFKYGTEEQKQEWLPRMCSDVVGSFCLSESSSGSDAFAMKCAAKPDGDDFILNGSKLWISNSDIAELFLVFANADFNKGYKGITAFLVPRAQVQLGKKEDKLGLNASGTCEVLFDNVRVPKSAVLGNVGEGYKVAIGLLNEGRIGIGAQMVGIAQGCFDMTIPYLKDRKQFGQSVADFQGMQFQIAHTATEIHAARCMVYEAARMKEAGLPLVESSAMAKYYSSECAVKTTQQCIKWLGGVGFTKDMMQEKFYRDCIVGTIYEGTSNTILQTIAKSMLTRY